ncbi:NADH:ubiquinone oxidoreductase subunit J [Hylemonella gracilis str. Niagara R]|uniref:NADH-quinone oxidoreductase subunit J n=1 Tax=Hylemonella gracilis str. Niagara R TaxID=1458275 RepID=A0A016XJ05_9BURK|nr:NADH-quinone oxidoreductase subunit J [Hylemonella gracilis]EYC52039.1 NADH:ubiquinone oxidoreductase subunit J [Hylemonella gracilis str. Niagara R]
MDVKTGFFFLFSAVLLISALRVVTARNPVHAVLFLMLAFSQASAIWLLLQAEFLAVALVLVYLGAVMVLFLFVVMMLDIRIDRLRQGFWKNLPLALLLGGIVVVEMAAVLLTGFDMVDPQVAAQLPPGVAEESNAKALGILLYTRYVWPIQIAAAILLVAMIAAIALTLRARKDSKAIDPSIQVRVRAADRLQLVKMDPTRPAEPLADAAATEEKKA